MMKSDVLLSELERFRKLAKVPAVAAALVTSEGTMASAVTGYRCRGSSELAGPLDRWHIGSCTKAMTAALYARLVEEGKAEWGMPLASLFPDLDRQIDGAWSHCTIDDVLRCRGGMKANLSPLQMRSSWADDSPLDDQRTQVALAALGKPPKKIGRFVYSNLGYIVAGAAIDRLAGIPFEEALQWYLLAPLGMDSVGFGPPPEICGHHCRLRLGGLLAFPGKPAKPGNKRSDNPGVLSSAGTVHVTMQDWSRFNRIFVSDGGGLLTSDSIRHLFEAPLGGGAPMCMGWMPTPSSVVTTYAFQGSNTMWSTTMMLSRGRDRVSLVACNDGRTSVLMKSAALAERLLGDTS